MENYSCRAKSRLRSHVRLYPKAAWNAIEAGFDGVEIQVANGYFLVLLVQFFQTVLNERTDEYGGSIDNRIHFPLEVVHVVVETIGIGAEGTAVRISPWSKYQSEENSSLIFRANKLKQLKAIGTNDPLPTLTALIGRVHAHPKLAFIHIVEPRFNGIIDSDLDDENRTQSNRVLRELEAWGDRP